MTGGCAFCAKESNRRPFLKHNMRFCPACGEPFAQFYGRVCPECGREVTRSDPRAVYCSHECQQRHNNRIQGAKKRARKRAMEVTR